MKSCVGRVIKKKGTAPSLSPSSLLTKPLLRGNRSTPQCDLIHPSLKKKTQKIHLNAASASACTRSLTAIVFLQGKRGGEQRNYGDLKSLPVRDDEGRARDFFRPNRSESKFEILTVLTVRSQPRIILLPSDGAK